MAPVPRLDTSLAVPDLESKLVLPAPRPALPIPPYTDELAIGGNMLPVIGDPVLRPPGVMMLSVSADELPLPESMSGEGNGSVLRPLLRPRRTPMLSRLLGVGL